MKKRAYFYRQLICSTILSILVFLLSGLPCFAWEISAQTAPAASEAASQQGPIDPKEFEAFIDRFFAKIKTAYIPGMAFVLVKDGKVFFSKGYGYANVENQTPVIPDKTLFRLGSLSKLFTATAVMQLVEQGKLDLNADINQYFKQFQVENNSFKPIASRHLLTHTEGFDVAWSIGAATRCHSEIPSLEQFLSKNLPKRVRQPDELYVYGDVGIALAGYLVEVISGVPFAQYMNQNILQPLDMRRSSFLQPLPANLESDLASGYNYRKGTYVKTPFICGKSAPTIGMSATATDIAHFTIAQLQGGRYGNTRILKESTVREMQRQHFTNFPGRNGMSGSAYGFYERFQNNRRAIEHGGSMYGYSSQIFMLPEHNLGFFVAFNHEDGVNLRENLIKQFLDRYYPEPKKIDLFGDMPKPSAESQQRLQQMNGSYRFIRYPQHSLAKLGIVWFSSRPDIYLKTNSDRTITLLPRGTKWVEVAPWLLRYRDSNNYLIFRRDATGKITNMSLSNYVFVTYEKLAWYETATFQRTLFGFCLLMFLSACYVWPLAPLIRRWRGRAFQGSRIVRIMRLLVGSIGVLNLFFIIGMLLVILQLNYWEFFLGMPTVFITLLYLPILTAGFTTALPIVGLLAWKDESWSIGQRFHYLLIVIASAIFIFLLNYWNLFGFRF